MIVTTWIRKAWAVFMERPYPDCKVIFAFKMRIDGGLEVAAIGTPDNRKSFYYAFGFGKRKRLDWVGPYPEASIAMAEAHHEKLTQAVERQTSWQ